MRRSLLAIFVPAILLGASFVNPAFAETNRQAICSASRYCTVNGGNGCGPGATCTNSPALMTACGYEVSDPNGIHSSNEGRCLTATQQTCLTDSGGCLDRDAGAPPASGATTICCSCTNGAQQMCAQFTDISACGNARNSQSYQALISRTPNPVANFNCTGGNLVETRCRPTAQNGICQQGPAPLSSLFPLQPTPPASQPAPIDSTTGNAQRAPGILPQLGVPIPGLTFSAASFSNGRTNSNFIAQYIAAIFRLGTQLAFVAATIMVTYGGFRYLIGSAGGDIKRGKEIIKDAIIGMLIAASC